LKVNTSDDLDTDVRLVQTCGAAPEQYDAFDMAGKPAGYLRLRHGHFTVSFPDVDGELLYEAYPYGDGAFADDERLYYLRQAILAIRLKLGLPAKPSKIYSIAEVAAHLVPHLAYYDGSDQRSAAPDNSATPQMYRSGTFREMSELSGTAVEGGG